MKAIIFEMKVLFGSCLVCHVIIFVWNWIFARRVCFDFEVFVIGLACSSWVGVSPTMVPSNLILWAREIPATELSLREGKSLQWSRVRVRFRVEEIPSTELRSWDSGRGKSLQQSPVSEWEKSHNGVSWRVEEPVCRLQWGNLISGWALEVIRMGIQACNELFK